MADASASVATMETATRDLLDRMSGSDPRRGMVNRLLFKLASRVGSTGSASEIAAMTASTAKLNALPAAGNFAAVVAEADAAAQALTPAS